MDCELQRELPGDLEQLQLRRDRAAARDPRARGRVPGEPRCGLLRPAPPALRCERPQAQSGGLRGQPARARERA